MENNYFSNCRNYLNPAFLIQSMFRLQPNPGLLILKNKNKIYFTDDDPVFKCFLSMMKDNNVESHLWSAFSIAVRHNLQKWTPAEMRCDVVELDFQQIAIELTSSSNNIDHGEILSAREDYNSLFIFVKFKLQVNLVNPTCTSARLPLVFVICIFILYLYFTFVFVFQTCFCIYILYL